MTIPNWRILLVEAAALLVATFVFSIFCIAPLKSMQGNQALQSEFGLAPNEVPPPPWILPFDDSYIFIRYAQQAHRGHAFQWNTGEASSGASSFLYPWILLPGQWLYDDIQGWSWWSRAVGFAGLWMLGVVAVFLMRTLGLAGPWPLATGLAVLWSGPVGFGAMTGMESALNAAALLLALTLWSKLSRKRHAVTATLFFLLVSFLPLLRPENLLLTLIGATAILVLPWAPLPKWTAPLLVLPGLGVALLNLASTGLAQPTAVVTKSWLGIAFPDLLTLIKLYLLGIWTEIGPVYLGARGFLLWPPVGLLALGTAVAALWGLPREILTRDRSSERVSSALRNLRPLALVWIVLLALAPMSSMPTWQGMRHHHSGLVCAWVLAFAGAGVLLDRLTRDHASPARVIQLFSFAPAILLLAFIPTWGGLYAQKAIEIHHRHGPAVAWLEEHSQDSVLLLNDAGILSLAHDGPAIDVMGLGTPGMAKAYRHGAGSMVEAVARRRPLPSIAAANLDVFRLDELLSTPLIEGLDPRDQTVVTEIDLALLDNTVLASEGIDFAHLESEGRADLRWQPAPDPYLASFALELPGVDGRQQLQGCRPIAKRIEIAVPPEITSIRVVLAPLAGQDSIVRFGLTGAGLGNEARDVMISEGRWNHFEAEVPMGTNRVWLEASARAAAPCLESVAFL